ncbi:MAG: hypothetical protein ABI894_09775 [Ilumatobacteraceae bacterium]
MRSKRRWWLALATLASPACSSTASSTDPTTSLSATEISGQATQSIPVSVAPEPTGVPGLRADDPFCSAWAGYVGTLQALGVAASFGELPSVGFAALELAAAPRLVEVAAAIDASWPDELSVERAVVIDQRIGPYARRASRGIDSLRSAGVSDAELATLSADWQQALSVRDPAATVIVRLPVSLELQAKVDAAAGTYDGAVTPFAQDPSLIVDGVENPATDAYLVTHCPDLASSGVGDAL